LLLLAVLALRGAPPARATGGPEAPSPTGRTPRLLWSGEWQAAWSRARAESLPLWLSLKTGADASGTARPRWDDYGQWATLAYQITGDPTYAAKAWAMIEPQLGKKPASRNWTREYFAEFVWIYDWLYPSLTPAQRGRFLDWLNYLGDLVLNRVSGVSWGTRTDDSDETVGHYFGLAFLDVATGPDNPRAGTFLSSTWMDAGVRSKSVGGLSSTGTNRDTMRNAIAQYAQMAEGGVWIESSEYNPGTLRLLLMGMQGVRTATGVDSFPEVSRLLPQLAQAQIHELAPDLTMPYQWGDVEQPRDLSIQRRVNFLGTLCGLLEADPLGPSFQQFTSDVMNVGPPADPWSLGRKPFSAFYMLYNPYAPAQDWRPLQPKSVYAPGQSLLFFHDGWDRAGSFFGAHSPPRTAADHEVKLFGDFQLYRKDEWAVTHPLGYSGPTIQNDGCNAMLLGSFSSMAEFRAATAQESGGDPDYAYLAGTTGGQGWKENSWQPPATFLHEWTRSLLYLPSGDKHSDTVVVFDRVNADNPKALPNFSRYTAADQAAVNNAPALKQWLLHAPVAPTVTGSTVGWQTAGGQNVLASTLLPQDARAVVYDEKQLWGSTWTVRPAEEKWQVRVLPGAERKWDTFLNVVQAYDGGTVLRNTVVRSAGGEAQGALVQRGGLADALVLFNARQGPDLPQPALKSGFSLYNPDAARLLKSVRLLTSGYAAAWTTDAPRTDLYLLDLDPARAWTACVDGSTVPLSVSGQGVGRLSVVGAGDHSLRLDLAAPSGSP
jgi:hypothetical protein